ncbi:hypothetical protein FH972_002634 [Carpinus fangiana]|uniref:Uncharacterized protein n=1 Tax=Carpinus fangiana TaxID=176857 RepID=A0A5N6QFH0_9ROSI|nr:hypothetical protein FH972_002634 [Carpinus fangiana]
MDEVVKKARGDALIVDLEESEAQELPHLLRCPRQQNAGGLIHALHHEKPLIHVLLLHAHPSAAKHHPFHALPKLRRHAVSHEAAVADPRHVHGLHHPLGLQHAHQAPGLEGLGPLGPDRVGVSVEDQVRHVDVEVWDQRGDEVGPLPHCVGSDAVDEDEVGFGGAVRLGDPAVHDCAVAEVRGGGPETRLREGMPVQPIPRGREAEALRHFFRGPELGVSGERAEAIRRLTERLGLLKANISLCGKTNNNKKSW